MKFILYDTVEGGYYGGQNKKYYNMFDMTVYQFAEEIDNIQEASRILNILNNHYGYNFVIKKCD